MTGPRRGSLVLGVHLFARGVAFTVFESPLSPIDWRVKEVRGTDKNSRALEAAKALIERFAPDVLVLENLPGSRAGRIRRLNRLLANHARGESIELHRFTRKEVQACFAGTGATTRHEIAQVIASHVHAMGHHVPRMRKQFTKEDARMGLFDAASLVMTYYCRVGGHELFLAGQPPR